MREFRCANCGEVETEENLRDYAVECDCKGENDMVCTTCEELNSFIEIEEDEEMVECTCIHCGDDFEAETLVEAEKETCPDCAEVLDDASNEELVIALAEEFGCAVKDIVENGNGEFSIDGTDYLVLTEDEAYEKVYDYIQDSLWAFSANFLSSVTDLPEEVFEILSEKCEGGNDAILRIVEKTCGMNWLVEEAIRWDGRGHFIDSYDGQEIEVSADGELYYCYRY